MVVFARMDLSSLSLCKPHSHLAGGQLFSWAPVGLDSAGIANGGIRPQPADVPHDQTPLAYDCYSGVDPLRRTCTSFLDRNANVRAGLSPRVAAITRAPICTDSDKTGVVLGLFRVNPRCMAYPGTVYAQRPVCDLAHARTSDVFWRRALVLVAFFPAFAKHLNWAAIVDALLPLSGHSAV